MGTHSGARRLSSSLMRHFPCILAVLTLVAACGGESNSDRRANERVIPFRKDGTLTFVRNDDDLTIDIEIAESDSARERGLMQRERLPERSGMLFIFESEGPRSFWMGNTPLGLDLIFVDADSQIVDIDKYNQPYNPSSIVSDAPAQYVVEVPAGFTDRHGISETQRIRWERSVKGRTIPHTHTYAPPEDS